MFRLTSPSMNLYQLKRYFPVYCSARSLLCARTFLCQMYTSPDQANWQLCRDNGLPPPITRHALHPFIMLWASHMGCTWIESCVVVVAVLRLSRRVYVTLGGAWHFWLTFGARYHVTFELGFCYIIPKFSCVAGRGGGGGGGGGGCVGGFTTSKGILRNLLNARKRNWQI